MQVGKVKVGSEHPIALQTMTTTDTRNVQATVDQVSSRAANYIQGCRSHAYKVYHKHSKHMSGISIASDQASSGTQCTSGRQAYTICTSLMHLQYAICTLTIVSSKGVFCYELLQYTVM